MQDIILQTITELSLRVPNLSYVKELKSGKEATVHLLTDGLNLYALKIYRENTKFASRMDYLNISAITDSRSRRAIKNKSKTGRTKLESAWTENEFRLMKALGEVSNNIPKVLGATRSSILMEYLGSEISPAPKLKDIKLTHEETQKAFSEICEVIDVLLDFGFVHGDLSEYNILWWEGKAYIIDFPQALDIGSNTNAFEKLNKDLANLEKYFFSYIDEPVLRNRLNSFKEKFLFRSTFG